MEAAVVSASLGAGGILLRKLGNMVADRYMYLGGGLRHEIQELKDELHSLAACLRDLDSTGHDDSRNQLTRAWMNQVRELGYDADDCIEIFYHHLMSKQLHSGDNTTGRLVRLVSVLRTIKIRNKLASDIKILKSDAHKISERRLRYRLDTAETSSSRNYVPMSMSSSSSSSLFFDSYNVYRNRQLPAVLAALHGGGDESRLVGMQGDRDKIIRWLDDDTASDGGGRLRVICIVGFGGLGKTTLAQAVYDSPAVMRGMGSRAFITVSKTYNAPLLLESIVRELVPRPREEDEDPLHGIECEDMSRLIDKTKQHLENKRYLIILDDVWDLAAWERLKVAFPNNKLGSRIIITTRHEQVVNSCASSSEHIHKMQHLTPEDSKKLLFKTVFGSEQCPREYDHFKEVCDAILDKCKNLPLAIVSIGGMLAQRKHKTVADWQGIIKRIPSEMETNPSLEGMRRVLSLSYDDLPYHLKSCFLYLSVFPEDHVIRRGALVRRWAAEGFIGAAAHSSLSLEEAVDSCFDEIVSRSMVTPEQLSSNGKVRSFKVHDIMLDVITAKCIQENFVSFVGKTNHQRNDTIGHGKVRRLSIQAGSCNNSSLLSSRSLPNVRSLIILGSTATERPLATITFTDMSLLRVLDLQGCRWLSQKDLKDICRLHLLRYLSLRGTTIPPQLPNKIGELKGLVTLDVRQTSVKVLPRSITQLQNLNHLLAGEYRYYTKSHSVKHFDYDTAVVMPPGFSSMRALQRISFLDVERSPHALREVEKLEHLTRLCVLQKVHGATWESFGHSLSKLSNSLISLSIMQYAVSGNEYPQLSFLSNDKDLEQSPPRNLQSLHLMGKLSVLPPWISSLHSLTTLSLRETYLGDDMVNVLGNLPSLMSLKLYRLSYTANVLCLERHQFLSLRQLVVDNMDTLFRITFQQGGAPYLETLSLALGCWRRRRISGINNLTKLRKVELYGDINEEEVRRLTEKIDRHPKRPIVTREDRLDYV